MRSLALWGLTLWGLSLLGLSGCVAITDFERDPPDALPPPPDAAGPDAYVPPPAEDFPVSGLEELDPATRAECAQICAQFEACAFDTTLNPDWECDPHPDNLAYGLNACVGFCATDLRAFQSITLARCEQLQQAEGIQTLVRFMFCIPESMCGLLCFEEDDSDIEAVPLEQCAGVRVSNCPRTCQALPEAFWACVAQDVFATLALQDREQRAEELRTDFGTLMCEHVAICLPPSR